MNEDLVEAIASDIRVNGVINLCGLWLDGSTVFPCNPVVDIHFFNLMLLGGLIGKSVVFGCRQTVGPDIDCDNSGIVSIDRVVYARYAK